MLGTTCPSLRVYSAFLTRINVGNTGNTMNEINETDLNLEEGRRKMEALFRIIDGNGQALVLKSGIICLIYFL